MHKLSPLVLAALLAAGCGTERARPTGSSVPKRDLTLSGQYAQVDVASPIELRRPFHQIATHAVRRMRQPTQQFEPTIISAVLNTSSAPASAPLPMKTAAEPVATSQPADPHELLPGKTITIIPVSNGPTSEGSRGEQPRTSTGHMGGRIGGHGGGCRGHGGRGGGSVPPAVLR